MASNYVLNVWLVREMFDLSRQTKKSVLQSAGIANTSWNDWIKTENAGDIPIRSLVEVCNVLRIPMRHLFRPEEGEYIVSSVKETFYPADRFKECRFDSVAFRKAFGIRSPYHKDIETMIGMMGITWPTYARWFEEERTLRVKHMLKFCRLFGYDLFDYVIDPNQPMDASEVADAPKESSVEESLRSENKQLKQELEALRKKYRELKANYRVLSEDLVKEVRKGELLRQRLEDMANPERGTLLAAEPK